MSGLDLIQLPQTVAELSNLQELNLDQNQLKDLPDAIAQLSKLKHLNLRANKFSRMPNAITRLSNLEKLHLSDNQLSQLPDTISEFSNLRVLTLSNNELRELPSAIARLPSLERLYLTNNQLSELPDGIAQLKKLKTLVLEGNRLPIPPEIIRQGWGEDDSDDGDPQSVIDYYFQFIKRITPTRSLNEVKVLLVGEGDVGKTSLLKRLLVTNLIRTNEKLKVSISSLGNCLYKVKQSALISGILVDKKSCTPPISFFSPNAASTYLSSTIDRTSSKIA